MKKEDMNWSNYWENVNQKFKSLIEPKLNIESVYSEYPFQKLEKTSNGWKACCPFHEDKTPSFVVYSKNLHYHCFGCKEHGTPSTFLVKTKGLTRKQALSELAIKAGVNESYLFSKEYPQDKIHTNASLKIDQLRKEGITNDIENENKLWKGISDETSTLFHRINQLEQSASRLLKMEKIRLNELDRIREMKSLVETQLNHDIELTNEKTTRIYRIKIDEFTSLKYNYDIYFNGENIDKIDESTFLEKESLEKNKFIIAQEHATYKIINGEFKKIPGDISSNEKVFIKRDIVSSNIFNNFNHKVSDLKDLGFKIKEQSDELNKIMAKEIHDLIDISLKIPKKEIEKIIESLESPCESNKLNILLPDGKSFSIIHKTNHSEIQKEILLHEKETEKKLFSEKLVKSDDGLWKSIDDPSKNRFVTEEKTNEIESTLESANRVFKESLNLDNPESRQAREYLHKRGLTDLDIDKWELGFVTPTSYSKLKELNLSQEEMQSAKLITNTGKPSFIGHRITFPIRNEDGVLCGFSAREIISKDANYPKYINSASSSHFEKGKLLYGLHEAKENIVKENSVIITEGFMDTIKMHKHGFKNTVAVMGTALSESHMNLLKGYTESVTLCFDSDKAGKLASQRSAESAGPYFKVNEITLGNAKDPDEFLEQFGQDKMRESLEHKKVISVPSQYIQNFVEKSDRINHNLYNNSIEVDI